MVSSYWIVLFIIVLGVTLSIQKRKLTIPAAATGGVAAFIIYAGSGVTGMVLLATFFILGVTATSHKWHTKKKSGFTDNDKGERTTGQVLVNSGCAIIVSILMLARLLEADKGLLMIAGGFAAAAADTVSSEMGNIYGRRFYNIVGFKSAIRGINGAISIEGTLAGIAASILIALCYLLTVGWLPAHLAVIVIAGTIGNIIDSLLGATLENKGILGNNAVNFINTCAGALAALGLSCF